MKSPIIACLGLACALATAAEAVERRRGDLPDAGPPADRLAQACGWYAILYCSEFAADAQRWSNRYGGRVIDTSSANYPSFRPGYFCVADGPMSRAAALERAANFRGVSPTAYAKNAC